MVSRQRSQSNAENDKNRKVHQTQPTLQLTAAEVRNNLVASLTNSNAQTISYVQRRFGNQRLLRMAKMTEECAADNGFQPTLPAVQTKRSNPIPDGLQRQSAFNRLLQRDEEKKGFQLRTPSLLEPNQFESPFAFDEKLHLDPNLMMPPDVDSNTTPFDSMSGLPSWLQVRPQLPEANTTLPDWFWDELPASPQPESGMRQLSRWLTGKLHRQDLAQIAGDVASAFGADRRKVRRSLNDAMISGGEEGLKALLEAMLKAIAGNPTKVESEETLPNGFPLPEKKRGYPFQELPLPPMVTTPKIPWTW